MTVKNIFLSAIAVGAIISATTASAEQAKPTNIAAWTQAVETRLDKKLQDSLTPGVPDHREGTAKVRFVLGDNGKPTNVTLAETSGRPGLDREAVGIVKRLGVLPALPAGSNLGDGVIVQIRFAAPSNWRALEDERQQVMAMRAEAMQQNVKSAAGGDAPSQYDD